MHLIKHKPIYFYCKGGKVNHKVKTETETKLILISEQSGFDQKLRPAYTVTQKWLLESVFHPSIVYIHSYTLDRSPVHCRDTPD